MIRLKLLSIRYNPYSGDVPDTNAWSSRFEDYLEHGWLRSPTCNALLETLEHLHWSDTECYTVLDAEGSPSPAHALPENTRLALTLVESSRRKEYTWLPADASQEDCEDMAARVWPALQAMEQPILVQGLYALHNDRGLFAAMDSANAVFEIRRRGQTYRGTYQEMAPQLEPTEYNSMRLLMAVNKGLADRPLPYPDEPLPFTPKSSEAPGLAGWSFTSVLTAEPYCADGGTILPCRPGEMANIICLCVTLQPDNRLTLDQIRTHAFDYDDLLIRVTADMGPGMTRRALLLASDIWDGWPEGAFLKDLTPLQRWGVEVPEYDHEVGRVFGFVLDGDAKTAELSEDAAALRMFRGALIDYRRQEVQDEKAKLV